MDAIQLFVRAVFSDTVTNVVLALLILLPLVDLVTGIIDAYRSGGQKIDKTKLDAFLRTSAAKAVNLMIILVFGRFVTVGAGGALNIPGIDFSILTGGGILYAVPFVVARLTSIQQNVTGSAPERLPEG